MRAFTIIAWTIMVHAISIQAFSQTNHYFPFPESNARWVEENNLDGETWIREYWVGIDTIIDGFQYKMMNSYPLMTFFFRQDTATRKVYMRNTYLQDYMKDTLVLDFSLKAGDTLWNIVGGSMPAFGFYDWVDAVDSVMVGNQYHRRLHIVTNYPIDQKPDTYWIEGAGDTWGFWTWFQYGPGYIRTQVTCFYQNDTLEWSQPSPSGLWDCDVYVGIQDMNDVHKFFSIFPNPASEALDIQMESELPIPGTFEIYDELGRLTYHANFRSEKPAIQVNTSSWPDGFYTCRFIDGSGNLNTSSFVIAHNH